MDNIDEELDKIEARQNKSKPYQKTFDFSNGLSLLKLGTRISRPSFDDAFLFLVPGSNFKVNRPPLLGIFKEGKEIKYAGHIDICYPSGKVAVWTPSQEDLLATDYSAQ